MTNRPLLFTALQLRSLVRILSRVQEVRAQADRKEKQGGTSPPGDLVLLVFSPHEAH